MSSFDIRLRLYSADGVRGKVLRTQTLTVNGVFSGLSSVTAQFSEKQFGVLPDWFIAALEYSDGLTWSEPEDARFIFSQDATDAADLAEIKTLTGTAYIPWLLQRNRLQYAVSLVNGQRPWNGPAGNILEAPLREGQVRGWGPYLTYDFTLTHDSAGQPWSATPIVQNFTVGVTAWDMVQWLVSSGNADFTTTGNVIHLWRPGHGVDRASVSSPVRITQKATSAPIKRSMDEVMTSITAQGDGQVVGMAATGADLGLGRLEGWVQVSGAATSGAALDAAKAAVAAASTVKREVSVTYSTTNGGPLPFISFLPGDIVQARYKGGWTALRVVELVLRRDSVGVVEVTTVLGNKFRSALGNLASRPAAGVGGAVTPAGGHAPIRTDLRKPKAPEGVTLTATGHWSADGSPVASLKVEWLAVTDAVTDELITVDQYEVWMRLASEAEAQRLTATGALLVLLDDLAPASAVIVTVRARSSSGIYSEFSVEAPITLPIPTEVMEPPSEPELVCKLTTVSARWDGSLATGLPPIQFRYIYTLMSHTEVGGYSVVGQNVSIPGNTATIAGLTLGDTVWFKFVAVDSQGVATVPSTPRSIVVTGVTGPDIEADSVTANNMQTGFLKSELIGLGAAMPSGERQNRVPAPTTDAAYWAKVIDGTIPLSHITGGHYNVAATAGGLVFTPAGGLVANIGVTTENPAPASMRVLIDWVDTSGNVYAGVAMIDAAGVSSYVNYVTAGQTVDLTPGTVSYGVWLRSDPLNPTTTVLSASVFEVIGVKTAQQAVYLSPQGIEITDDSGNYSMRLGTWDENFISIFKLNPIGQPITQATIDDDGVGTFQTVNSAGDVNVLGAKLVGAFASARVNGGSVDNAMFDRVARGIQAVGDFGRMKGTGPDNRITTSATAQALMAGRLTLNPGRLHSFAISGQFVAYWNATGTPVLHMEVWLGDSAQNVASPNGALVADWVILPSDIAERAVLGLPALPPLAGLYGTKYVLVRLITAVSRSYSIADASDTTPNNPKLIVRDEGPDWAYSDMGSVASRANSGTPTVPPSPSVATYGAAWAESHSSGGGVNGASGSLYQDGRMVQGGGTGGARVSYVGFPALGLSGKQILLMRLRLRNRHTGVAAGATVQLGANGLTGNPGALVGAANRWDDYVSKGEDKWYTIPSGLYSSFASGALRAISLGDRASGSLSNYGIFDSVSNSNALGGGAVTPLLEVTYQ